MLVGVLGLVLLGPGVARADNAVIASSPDDGSIVDTSPNEIVIDFLEELGEQNTIALQCDADLVTLPRPEVVGDTNRTLTVEIQTPLPAASCVVTWAVSTPEAEPNGSGNITFTVQNETAAPPTTVEGTTTTATTTADGGTTSTPTTAAASADSETLELGDTETGQGPLWLGRLISTLGVAVLFGALLMIAAAWPEGTEYLLAVRFIRSAWIVAVIGTILYVAAATAAVNDEGLGSGFSPGGWLDLADAGWPGRAALARLALVVVSAWVAFRPDRVIDPTTQFAALGLPALAVVTIGFSRVEGDLPWLGVAIGVTHALAMAVWIGGVILVGRVVLAGPGEEDLVHAVRGFSRVSVPAIGLTLLSGVVQMIRLDGGDLFTSSHGRAVVFKTVVVAVMVFIAISARQFVNQRMSRANEMSVPLADRLRRAFGTEALIGIAVLAISAWLVALDPSNVDEAPSIDYAISRSIEVPEADLDVTIRLTRDRLLPDGTAPSGLEVDVSAPETGLSNMEVVFTAPPNDEVGTITQPVPLTGAGKAVRLESPEGGLPLGIAGDWTVQVNAITPSGVVNSEPVQFTILESDGSAPTTAITIPPVSIVTLPTTTVAPEN